MQEWFKINQNSGKYKKELIYCEAIPSHLEFSKIISLNSDLIRCFLNQEKTTRVALYTHYYKSFLYSFIVISPKPAVWQKF